MIKKISINKNAFTDIVSITLQSEDTEEQITANSMTIQGDLGKATIIKHILNIGFFNNDDLAMIVDAIDDYLFSCDAK